MTSLEKSAYMKIWRKTHKPNRRSYFKQWRMTHKKSVRKHQSKWMTNNPDKWKHSNDNWRLKTTYGITIEEYNQMLLQQKGCCAICGTHSSNFKRKLHVDHNHTTGRVRGLLCVKCNYGLGYFGEDLSVFEKAKKYLQTDLDSVSATFEKRSKI